MDPAQLADLLGIARKTVYVLVERGEIGHHRIGNRIRFSRLRVLEFLRSNRQDG